MSRKKPPQRRPAATDVNRQDDAANAGSRRQLPLYAVAAAGLLVIAGLIWFWMRAGAPAASVAASKPLVPTQSVAPAQYVDEQQCAACHAQQAGLWHGSHHDLAMQEATAATVLGNFNDATFSKDGVRTRFFTRDGRFWINTDGPDGKPADFEVKYTFGVEPLQQYLLQLDRGRLQAFTVAWDTQRKRWFHLYPDERIDHRDELHWTRLSQNWNYMCAECHSTDLKKNYDAATQTYDTTWKQIDVGCQACHGPASVHVANVSEARHGTGRPKTSLSASGTPSATRHPSADFPLDLAAGPADAQIDMCARCHSRRATIWGDYRHGKPLLDTHLPSLLEASLYFVDGQIDGEAYEYGSFLQAKMHQKGLRCSDCHEPHSLKTRAPGNALCTSCHNTATAAVRAGIDTSGLHHKDYDSPAHHFHKSGQPGSQCVDCHAPQRTYMVVDPRRDHSFRIPRPDLSARLETPNACNTCHQNRSSQWASDAVARWYGPERRREHTYGEAIWTARNGQPGAVSELVALARDTQQPAIVRATALEELRGYPGTAALEAAHSQSGDEHSLVRLAAMNALEILPPERVAPLVTPFLDDAVRAVRLDAVRLTSRVPAQALGQADRERLARGIHEFEAAQRENADHPSSWMNLGNLYASVGDAAAAEAAYQSAIRLDNQYVPAYVNLADLKSQQGDNAMAIALLRSALDEVPRNAALQHALGLALVRERRIDEALGELQRAMNNDPHTARYAYVYAVALHDSRGGQQGVAVLRQALQLHPGDRSILSALAAYAREAGDLEAMQRYQSRLDAMEAAPKAD